MRRDKRKAANKRENIGINKYPPFSPVSILTTTSLLFVAANNIAKKATTKINALINVLFIININ